MWCMLCLSWTLWTETRCVLAACSLPLVVRAVVVVARLYCARVAPARVRVSARSRGRHDTCVSSKSAGSVPRRRFCTDSRTERQPKCSTPSCSGGYRRLFAGALSTSVAFADVFVVAQRLRNTLGSRCTLTVTLSLQPPQTICRPRPVFATPVRVAPRR